MAKIKIRDASWKKIELRKQLYTNITNGDRLGKIINVKQLDTGFLLLDGAVASRAVFVIVSRSDRRAETRLEPANKTQERKEIDQMYQ